MSYIEESLSKDEEIKEQFKLHWFSKVPMILWIIISPLTLGISLLIAIYEFFRLRSIEQGVTNKRVVRKTGIVSRKSEEVKLTSIETVEIEQGIFGRMFGYGNIKITGKGISDLVFPKIDEPMEVKKAIESVEPI